MGIRRIFAAIITTQQQQQQHHKIVKTKIETWITCRIYFSYHLYNRQILCPWPRFTSHCIMPKLAKQMQFLSGSNFHWLHITVQCIRNVYGANTWITAARESWNWCTNTIRYTPYAVMQCFELLMKQHCLDNLVNRNHGIYVSSIRLFSISHPFRLHFFSLLWHNQCIWCCHRLFSVGIFTMSTHIVTLTLTQKCCCSCSYSYRMPCSLLHTPSLFQMCFTAIPGVQITTRKKKVWIFV